MQDNKTKKDNIEDTDKLILNGVDDKIEQHLNEMLDADDTIDTAELLNTLEDIIIDTVQENANVNIKLKNRIAQLVDTKDINTPEIQKKIREKNAYNEILIRL